MGHRYAPLTSYGSDLSTQEPLMTGAWSWKRIGVFNSGAQEYP